MSKSKHTRGAAARDRPAAVSKSGTGAQALRAAGGTAGAMSQRGVVFLGQEQYGESLRCGGYVSLAHSPEIVTAVDRIAALMGAMPIHVYRNGEKADLRVSNPISRIVDINPNSMQTRAMWMRWIIRTLYIDGNGNAVVMPLTDGGRLRALGPVPAMYASFYPSSLWNYRIAINGEPYDPETLLHFVLNPGRLYPWLGEGPRVIVSDVANNLKQATATEKGFMESKWKPSIIVKVDALTEEFSGPEGRQKLLDSYVTNSEEGQPWIIPAEAFEVQTVKPLTLSDLALADFVELDKRTVASILGVPPFVLGVGEFKRDAWNNFISTTLMPLADSIAQELTRKLLGEGDLYFRFNSRALLDYDLTELIKSGVELVDRAAMRRNELRDWVGLPYDEEMDELLMLENYLPTDRLGDQKKLNEGGGDDADA